MQILDRQGEKALGKPVGVYETMWIPPDCRPTPEAVQTLGDILSSLLALKPDTSVLVVGLGNRAMTPDAIGPWTVSGLLVTRHLHRQMPGLFGDMRPVSALEPGGAGYNRHGKRGNCKKASFMPPAPTGYWWWTPWRLPGRTGYAKCCR